MVSDPEMPSEEFTYFGLNPCSNGIWSLTLFRNFVVVVVLSLNPCSNGIWSLTPVQPSVRQLRRLVLILVLMEYGL